MNRPFKIGGTNKGRGQPRYRCAHCGKKGLGAMRAYPDGKVYKECRYCLSLTAQATA